LVWGDVSRGFVVHKLFARWPLLRRAGAVVAAYAIALSGLIASLSAVRIAIADASSSDIVICQPTLFGNPAPGSDHGDLGKLRCVGCLIQLAAVPPPPTASVAVEQTAGQVLALPADVDFHSDPRTRSHQSRAPPYSA
jgi:Protein of unknown function (DUF2946)